MLPVKHGMVVCVLFPLNFVALPFTQNKIYAYNYRTTYMFICSAISSLTSYLAPRYRFYVSILLSSSFLHISTYLGECSYSRLTLLNIIYGR